MTNTEGIGAPPSPVRRALALTIGAAVALAVAYRRQKVREQENDRAKRAEQRENTKLFNERFGAASAQLGHDKAAVRMAGVYALAGLADDWAEQRQTCIDVLCAYLRLPYDPQSHREGEKEVRHTILRIVRDHLRDPGALNTWCGRDFDFTGAVFDGGRLDGAKFTGGTVSFHGAEFTGGRVDFVGAEFIGGEVDFSDAKFSGGEVFFSSATFSGGTVSFAGAEFTGTEVFFAAAKFTGSEALFVNAQFSSGEIHFVNARFTGGEVYFAATEFCGGRVNFQGTEFSGGHVTFLRAEFTGGDVDFSDAKFTGSEVFFSGAKFDGGEVDLAAVGEYSRPPQFDAWERLPPGLRLPASRRNT